MTGSPSQPAGFPLPKAVQIKGNAILWSVNPHPEYVRITDNALMEFAHLTDADAASIRDYALKRGVLLAMKVDYSPRARKKSWKELASKGSKRSKRWEEFVSTGSKKSFDQLRSLPPNSLHLNDGTLWQISEVTAVLRDRREPVELWRILARRMQAVLRINAALKGRPEIGEEEDWKVLWGTTPPDIATAQWIFQGEINWWLEAGRVRPFLAARSGWSTSKAEWKLETAYTGLIGGLAHRLLVTVIGEDKLFTCDGCGQPYIRVKRAPRPGQENFCDECEDAGRPKARAVQRYRERKRNNNEQS